MWTADTDGVGKVLAIDEITESLTFAPIGDVPCNVPALRFERLLIDAA